ncbi:unnamed protein product [Musa banksii]
MTHEIRPQSLFRSLPSYIYYWPAVLSLTYSFNETKSWRDREKEGRCYPLQSFMSSFFMCTADRRQANPALLDCRGRRQPRGCIRLLYGYYNVL